MSRVFDLKFLFASLVVITYAFLSLFGVINLSHNLHTDHNTIPNCPYMVGEQSLCQMNFLDHVVAWQHFAKATFASTNLLPVLIFFTGLAVYLSASPPNLSFKSRRYVAFEPLYQSLFSDGILNSKAF